MYMKTYIQNTIIQRTNSMPFVLPISKSKTPIFPFYAPKQTQDMNQIPIQTIQTRMQTATGLPRFTTEDGSCDLMFSTGEMIFLLSLYNFPQRFHHKVISCK